MVEVRSARAHPPALIIKWREKLGLAECPYVYRWRIDARKVGSIRVHHWLAQDDPRAFHDHPWWFVTLVIRGGYTDATPDGGEHLRAPCVRFRPALYRHTVIPDRGGAWTILLTGRNTRVWGFWERLPSGTVKFRKARRWFESKGHHPCDSGS